MNSHLRAWILTSFATTLLATIAEATPDDPVTLPCDTCSPQSFPVQDSNPASFLGWGLTPGAAIDAAKASMESAFQSKYEQVEGGFACVTCPLLPPACYKFRTDVVVNLTYGRPVPDSNGGYFVTIGAWQADVTVCCTGCPWW
jgi:hypothetical protein